MPIRACPDCGSDRLVFPKSGSTTFTCNDCPWSGTPNEFPNYSAWQDARATQVTLKEKVPNAPAEATAARQVVA